MKIHSELTEKLFDSPDSAAAAAVSKASTQEDRGKCDLAYLIQKVQMLPADEHDVLQIGDFTMSCKQPHFLKAALTGLIGARCRGQT